MLQACCGTMGIVGVDAVTVVVPESPRLPQFVRCTHGTLHLLPCRTCLTHIVWLVGPGPPASVWVACVGSADTKRRARHLLGVTYVYKGGRNPTSGFILPTLCLPVLALLDFLLLLYQRLLQRRPTSITPAFARCSTLLNGFAGCLDGRHRGTRAGCNAALALP
jgi:hypothetical protein